VHAAHPIELEAVKLRRKDSGPQESCVVQTLPQHSNLVMHLIDLLAEMSENAAAILVVDRALRHRVPAPGLTTP